MNIRVESDVFGDWYIVNKTPPQFINYWFSGKLVYFIQKLKKSEFKVRRNGFATTSTQEPSRRPTHFEE